MQAQSGHRADDALAPAGRGLDGLAVPHDDHERDHAGQREVDVIKFGCLLRKSSWPCSNRNVGQVRKQKLGNLLRGSAASNLLLCGPGSTCMHGAMSRPVGLGLCSAGIDVASENRRRSAFVTYA